MCASFHILFYVSATFLIDSEMQFVVFVYCDTCTSCQMFKNNYQIIILNPGYILDG